MQKLFILYLFLNATISFSQNLEPAVFAKVNTFRHTGFEDNIFADGALGVSLFSTYWISPKIGFKRIFGNPNDVSFFNETYQELISSKYKGNVFTVGAKIRLTKPEDAWLFIWPEYSFGDVKFESSYYKTEDDVTRLALQERINSKNYNSWFDLSTGVEFYFDNNERFLTSVYLTYTLLDLGSGFEKLSFENTTKRPPSKNNSTIGLGVSIEYCFCKKNQD